MKTTNQLTIAIPGEKRNGQQVRKFLKQAGLISENDMNLELISSSKIGARFIQMRTKDALSRVGNGIDLAITGLDQMRENVGFLERFYEGNVVGFYENLWKNDGQTGCRILQEEKSVFDIPFLLDDGNSTKIQLLTPSDKIEKNINLADEIIENVLLGKIRILTPYPILASKVLKMKTGIPIFPTDLKKVDGKTEVMIRAGYGDFGIDVVDTGDSAKRNGLIPTEVLYESYPAGIVSSTQLEKDKILQEVVSILTEASNNAYYTSPNYRNRYPRG